jgi:hypothetical protein
MERIAIVGWPKTGKTTLATEMGGGRSTDEVMNLGWSEASQEASTWFDQPGPLIVEGVAVPRALRKWRERNPDKPPPIDKLIILRNPHVPLEPGQVTMGKGLDTVLNGLMPWLSSSIEVETR